MLTPSRNENNKEPNKLMRESPRHLNTRLLTESNRKRKKGPEPPATAGPHGDILFKHVSVCVSADTQ